jgi:hypothetical protein
MDLDFELLQLLKFAEPQNNININYTSFMNYYTKAMSVDFVIAASSLGIGGISSSWRPSRHLTTSPIVGR